MCLWLWEGRCGVESVADGDFGDLWVFWNGFQVPCPGGLEVPLVTVGFVFFLCLFLSHTCWMPSILLLGGASTPGVRVALPLPLLTLWVQLGALRAVPSQLPCLEYRNFWIRSLLGAGHTQGRCWSAHFGCFSAYLCQITNLCGCAVLGGA